MLGGWPGAPREGILGLTASIVLRGFLQEPLPASAGSGGNRSMEACGGSILDIKARPQHGLPRAEGC